VPEPGLEVVAVDAGPAPTAIVPEIGEFITSLGLTHQVVGTRTSLYYPSQHGPIGFIHQMGKKGDRNLKGTCEIHKNCGCWIQPRVNFACTRAQMEHDLVEWILWGLTLDAESHREKSRELRIKFGMNPK
jgi:hypothetical protein